MDLWQEIMNRFWFTLKIPSAPVFSLVELTEDILKQLMDLVFTLVCNGELSLARVLRKNILDKVEQKKLLRCTNSLKPLAARGVSARYSVGRVFEAGGSLNDHYFSLFAMWTIEVEDITLKFACAYRPGTLHDFRSHEIADQLTLLDAELFYKIEVRLLLCVKPLSVCWC